MVIVELKPIMEQGKAEDPEGAEGQLNLSEWNYGADLDIIKTGLSKATGTGEEQEYVRLRNLLTTCVSLIQKQLGSSEGRAPEDLTCQNPGKLVRCRNPLEIHLILNEVLSYLPVKSLLTCRLVNQTWNAKALPWIQKKMTTSVFATREEFPMFCADFDCADVLPFESLKIILQGMNKDDCHKFFTKHGAQLRKLESNEYKSATEFDESALQENLKMLQHIFRHVPNLKTLYLNLEYLPKLKLFPGLGLFDFDEGESVTLTQVKRLTLRWAGSLSQEFLDGLSTLLPNIAVIQLAIPFSGVQEQDWEVFGNFLGQRLSLHTIHFPHIMSSNQQVLFRIMTTQGSPKLKRLNMSLKINLNSFNNEDLRLVESQEHFLKSQSDNLELLNLTISYQNLNRNVTAQHKRQFPAFKSLTTAMFDNLTNDEPSSWYPYLPLEPEHLPKLQTLSVVPKTIQSEVFADSLFLSVEEVKLRRWSTWNIGLLSKIGSRFPNLRKLSGLEIGLNLNAIQTIVTNFPEIEDLELKIFDRHGEHFQNFNLIISGIPADKWALAQEQLAECSGYQTLPSWMDPPGPSFRDLKRLKRLVLFPCPEKRPRLVRIDEIGVYLTFLRLSPQLNLTLRGTFTISEELAAKLRGHYQNIYFIPK